MLCGYVTISRYTTLAHGIYLETPEYEVLRDTALRSPLPNVQFVLGSGFDFAKDVELHRAGIATDVGVGTSLSMLTTLNEAYKVQQPKAIRYPRIKKCIRLL